MVNNINPKLLEYLNQDYSIPLGKTKVDIIEELKNGLYDEERKRKHSGADARAVAAPTSAKKRKGSSQGSTVAAAGG
eukprot:2242969-Pleurochrysis_carterae.AAC.1